MARYALIDGYLDAMRDGLHWRRDLDDLVSEMEDHLYSTVETLCATGNDRTVAERKALDRFGDPKTLAAVYASTTNGGLAMPTQFTRRAGTFALISAALIAAFGAYWIIWMVFLDSQFEWEGAGSTTYTIATVALAVAFFSMTFATVGITQRTGTTGVMPIISFVLLGLAIPAAMVSWFIAGWMLLGGLGALIGSIVLLRSGLGNPAFALLYGLGLLAGLTTFTLLTTMEVGRVDEWGDYPVAALVGIGVGCFTTAIGLAGIGRWLRSENPADIEPTPIPA